MCRLLRHERTVGAGAKLSSIDFRDRAVSQSLVEEVIRVSRQDWIFNNHSEWQCCVKQNNENCLVVSQSLLKEPSRQDWIFNNHSRYRSFRLCCVINVYPSKSLSFQRRVFRRRLEQRTHPPQARHSQMMWTDRLLVPVHPKRTTTTIHHSLWGISAREWVPSVWVSSRRTTSEHERNWWELSVHFSWFAKKPIDFETYRSLVDHYFDQVKRAFACS